MTRPTDPKNMTSSEEALLISGFSVEEQVQESIYIARLFQRLLSEYRYLKATRLQFMTGQDTLRAVLFAEESELKSWSLKDTWFHPLLRWLSARISPLHESSAAKPDEFFCAVRVQAEVLEFHSRVVRVAGKEKELTLDRCTLHTPLEYLRACGCSERLATNLDELLSAQRGLITIAAPSAGQSLKALSFVLGVSQSHLISDPSLSSLRKLLADKVVLVETAVGNDSIEILLERANYVRELGENYVGVICGGFARRVCGSCAREVRTEEAQSSPIPEDLRPRIPEVYLRGNGCAVCAQSGYRGQVFLGSLALVDMQVRELAASKSASGTLAEYLYAKGTRPLLEYGLGELRDGTVTFESIYEVTKNLPSLYRGIVGGRVRKSPSVASMKTDPAGAGNADPLSQPVIPQKASRAKPLLLVVEDDGDQRTILDMVFKSANYEVMLTPSGVQALAWLAGNIPDAIITDLMMPEMDGREFVARLKSNPAWAGIPVMVLTVVSDGDKEYDLLDLGADDYCEKTVQRKVLLKRVEHLVKRGKPSI